MFPHVRIVPHLRFSPASRPLIARCVSISPFALMFPHVRIVPHLRFSPASRPLTRRCTSAFLPASRSLIPCRTSASLRLLPPHCPLCLHLSPFHPFPHVRIVPHLRFSLASRSLIARCVSISPLSIRSPMFVSFRISAFLPASCPLIARCVSISPLFIRSPMFVSFRTSASRPPPAPSLPVVSPSLPFSSVPPCSYRSASPLLARLLPPHLLPPLRFSPRLLFARVRILPRPAALPSPPDGSAAAPASCPSSQASRLQRTRPAAARKPTRAAP